MTNTKGIVLLFSLATILITGGLTIAPAAYSTGYGDDSHGDDSHGDDSHGGCGDDSHGDDSNGDCEPTCECKKPTVLTVLYTGPGIEDGLEGTENAEVTVEIYKKESHIGDKDPLLTIDGIFNGEEIIIDSNVYGKKKIKSNTVYHVIQNDAPIATISFHTSCSDDMLYVGASHTDGDVTLTVESGFDHKGRQSVFLPDGTDPICNEIPATTLEVRKILSPADDSGTFILQIDGAPVSDPVGNGGTSGPVDVIPGSYIVGEIAGDVNTDLADYTRTIGGDCDPEEEGTITLVEGDNAVCTITNTKIVPAMITFKKALTNDNNGDALPHDFAINLTRTDGTNEIENENFTNINPSMGQTETFEIPAGTYSLSELLIPYPDGNLASASYTTVVVTGDTACPSMVGEEFEVKEGEDMTCTIYNDDNFVPGQTGGDGIFFHRLSVPINIPGPVGSTNACSVPFPVAVPAGDLPCVQEEIPNNSYLVHDANLGSDTAAVLVTITPTAGGAFGVCELSGILDADTFKFTCSGAPAGDYNVNYALIETPTITP